MKRNIFLIAFLFFAIATYDTASAHCDGIDGPVVMAAKKSIEENNVNYVLAWIKPEYEQEIRATYLQVMDIRNQNEETKKITDYYFFETVVRLHRLGEGEPYTGLKPSGTKVDKGIVLADQSIADHNLDELEASMINEVKKSLDDKYQVVMQKSNYDPNDIGAAREYVEAYVQFIHFSEKMFEASESPHSDHVH